MCGLASAVVARHDLNNKQHKQPKQQRYPNQCGVVFWWGYRVKWALSGWGKCSDARLVRTKHVITVDKGACSPQ